MPSVLNPPRRLARRARVVAKTLEHARNLDSSATFYPEASLKSAREQLREQVEWAIKNGEIPKYYHVYGLDRVGTTIEDYPAPMRFRRTRDQRNWAGVRADPAYPAHNYVALLRDKHLFSLFANSLGYPTPAVLAFLRPVGVEWLPAREPVPLSTLTERDIDGFCKTLGGLRGEGAFTLRSDSGTLYVNGEVANVTEVRDRVNETYVLQERIVQHPVLAALHPPSVNSLRIITVLEQGTAQLFQTFLRVGAEGRSVDNPGAGGIAVAVDPARGCLTGYGITRTGATRRSPTHPDTAISYEGYEIPFFNEAVEVALGIHRELRHVHTVGWDVAITPDGPTLVEGNDNWGEMSPMALDPTFWRRFNALFETSAAPV